MTINRFEEIKESIEQLKKDQVKAETVIEGIKKQWGKYDIATLEEAQEKASGLEESIEKNQNKLDSLTEKIEAIIP